VLLRHYYIFDEQPDWRPKATSTEIGYFSRLQ